MRVGEEDSVGLYGLNVTAVEKHIDLQKLSLTLFLGKQSGIVQVTKIITKLGSEKNLLSPIIPKGSSSGRAGK